MLRQTVAGWLYTDKVVGVADPKHKGDKRRG